MVTSPRWEASETGSCILKSIKQVIRHIIDNLLHGPRKWAPNYNWVGPVYMPNKWSANDKWCPSGKCCTLHYPSHYMSIITGYTIYRQPRWLVASMVVVVWGIKTLIEFFCVLPNRLHKIYAPTTAGGYSSQNWLVISAHMPYADINGVKSWPTF